MSQLSVRYFVNKTKLDLANVDMPPYVDYGYLDGRTAWVRGTRKGLEDAEKVIRKVYPDVVKTDVRSKAYDLSWQFMQGGGA